MSDPLPEIEAAVLWIVGFHDGPLSGVCLVDDRVCWFETPADIFSEKRSYFVYELTDEECRSEVTRHFLFEQYVGLHWCNHATLDGTLEHRVHPTWRHRLFYDREPADRSYVTGKQPIGKLTFGGLRRNFTPEESAGV